jgi:hypothetical protein
MPDPVEHPVEGRRRTSRPKKLDDGIDGSMLDD